MTWQQTFGTLDAVLSRAPKIPSYQPVQSIGSFYGASRAASPLGRPASIGGGGVDWSKLASGAYATDRVKITQPGMGDRNPFTSGVQETNPFEKLEASLPYSSTGPRSPYAPPAPTKPQSTQGDLFGSFGASVGQTFTGLNLGNAIPFFMERIGVLSQDLADAGIPGVSALAQVGAGGMDVFLNAFKAVAQPVGEALAALPEFVRDGQLKDRAKVYRAIVSGGDPTQWGGPLAGPISSPINSILQLGHDLTPLGAVADWAAGGSLVDFSGSATKATFNVSGEANMAKRLQEAIRNATDPNERLTAEQHLAILRESLDLPESVKLQIESNPTADDDQINRWLDEAPEGRAWSYGKGANSFAQNLGNDLLFFLAEFKGLTAATAAARGVAGAAEFAPIAYGAEGLARGASISAKLLTGLTASGVGITAFDTVGGALARYAGDEAAVRWFDHSVRTTPFSDDPMTQLVTGFAVNPFRVAGAAKRGIVKLRNGVEAVVDTGTGHKLNTIYSSPDVVDQHIARMFKLGDPSKSRPFLYEHGIEDAAPDIVVGTALDIVLDRLPAEERMAFLAAHPQPAERTAAALTSYGDRVMTVLEREPREIAARWHDYNWNYRQMDGPFNASVSARITSIYRRNMERSYSVREGENLTVTYRDTLPPQGQGAAISALDDVTEGGMVRMADWQMLQANLPVLARFSKGIVRGDQAAIPRADLDRVVELAAADFAHRYKVNPIRATTGSSPVLGPHSGTPLRDQAEGFGTSIETIQAIQKADVGDTTAIELVRRFLVDKLDLDESFNVNKLEAPALYERATAYLDDTGQPWRAQGERLAFADAEITRLRGELADLHSFPRDVSRDAAIEELERQLLTVKRLNETVLDPVRPFTSEVASAASQARFRQRVNRIRPKTMTNEQRQELWDYLAASGKPVTGTSAELLSRVKEILAKPAPEAFHEQMLERARIVVDAQERLDRLGLVDDGLEMLGGTALFKMFTKVEGSYKYSGGLPPISRAMRARMANGFRNAGLRGEAGEAMTMSDYDLWRHLMRSADKDVIREALLPVQRKMVERVEGRTGVFPQGPDVMAASARNVDTVRTGAGDAEKMSMGSDEAWLEQAIRLLNERDDLLGNQTRPVIEKIAGTRIPAEVTQAIQAEEDFARYGLGSDYAMRQENIARFQVAVNEAIEHPGLESRQVVKAIIEEDDHLFSEMTTSPEWRKFNDLGAGVDPFASDELADVFMPWLRKKLVPVGFEPPAAGVAQPSTAIDEAIAKLDARAVADEVATAIKSGSQIKPLSVPRASAPKVVTAAIGRRASTTFKRQLRLVDADLATMKPNAAILDDMANRTGVEAMSVINHGIVGTRPATIQSVLSILEEIENGNAARAGIGQGFQDEAKRVATMLLKVASTDAKRSAMSTPEVAGRFRWYSPEDAQALATDLDDLLKFDDPTDPFAGLTYGIGKAPKDAVVMEWHAVPTLTEEFLARKFQPWEERIGTHHVSRALNHVFGPTSNQAIRAETRNRFVERLSAQGVGQDTARAIWDKLQHVSNQSRRSHLRLSERGSRDRIAADNPMYASISNIPNRMIEDVAHGFQSEKGVLRERFDAGEMTQQELDAARVVDYATALRESTSTTRRALADSKLPFGKRIANAYGLVAHNEAVTTLYYLFRFGLDIRYHAMNYLEAQILYMGRAGMRKGEIDEGLLGQTSSYLRNEDLESVAANTGWEVSRDRFDLAYKTFLKEQPDALRAGLREIDETTMRRSIEELAERDPQLRDMQREFAATPDEYLAELDAWHKKMLTNIDDADGGKSIDEIFAEQMREAPEIAQVIDKLAQVNKDLWADIRQTFYGNPDRSRAERFLNSYLLYWPLSYQIKSTKWFLRVLGDRAGGLPTNAAGAYEFNQIADTHNRLLEADAKYRDWFEEHQTLVFVAQMLFPVSFDKTGVSLNPIVRGLFFDRDVFKALNVGPVYTFSTLLPQVREEASADLYPAIKDIPIVSRILEEPEP